MQKRTAISIILLIVLGILLYFIRRIYGQQTQEDSVENNTQQTGLHNQTTVSQLLQQPTLENNTQQTDMKDVDIDPTSPTTYAGGGEYRAFFPQTIKQALQDKKRIVLYFFDAQDPTDKALDNDIQKRQDRIPANVVIVRVEFDAQEKLRKNFNVTQPNTIVFLDSYGTEETRRSQGLTSLSHIVRAME